MRALRRCLRYAFEMPGQHPRATWASNIFGPEIVLLPSDFLFRGEAALGRGVGGAAWEVRSARRAFAERPKGAAPPVTWMGADQEKRAVMSIWDKPVRH